MFSQSESINQFGALKTHIFLKVNKGMIVNSYPALLIFKNSNLAENIIHSKKIAAWPAEYFNKYNFGYWGHTVSPSQQPGFSMGSQLKINHTLMIFEFNISYKYGWGDFYKPVKL